MRWLDGIIDSVDVSLSKLGDNEGQGSLQSMGSQRVGSNLATKGQLRFYILKTGNEEANHFLFLPEKHA